MSAAQIAERLAAETKQTFEADLNDESGEAGLFSDEVRVATALSIGSSTVLRYHLADALARVEILESRLASLTNSVSGFEELVIAARGNAKMISTKRDASGNLIATVTEGGGEGAGDLIKRLAYLEAKLAEVETRGSFEYRGVFTPSENYKRGDSITWHGDLWIAVAENPTEPPPSPSWKLAVRKGRDAKGSSR